MRRRMTCSGPATRRCASPTLRRVRRPSRRRRISDTCACASKATTRRRSRRGSSGYGRWGKPGATPTCSSNTKEKEKARSSPRSSGRFPLSLRWFAFLGALPTLQARLERFHQIEDLRLRRFGRLLGDFLAIDLLLNLIEDPLPHVVLVRLRLEFLGRPLIDELDRHVELGLLHFGLGDRHVSDRTQLLGIA